MVQFDKIAAEAQEVRTPIVTTRAKRLAHERRPRGPSGWDEDVPIINELMPRY